jgi:hypothetical protein
MDGYLAWRDLYENYEEMGNKDELVTAYWKELCNLKLEYNSFGGFENLALSLEELGHPVEDVFKKTTFINGISDPDFSMSKSIAQKDNTYKAAKLTLQQKAIELKRLSGPGGQGRRGNNTQQGESDRGECGGRGGRGRGKGKGRGQGNRGGRGQQQDALPNIPPETFDKLAPEVKKWMKDARAIVNKSAQGQGYGNQYQKNQGGGNCNANNQSTEEKRTQDQDEDAHTSVTERAGNIWRSGNTRHHDMAHVVRVGGIKSIANINIEQDVCGYDYALVDSACDTCGIGAMLGTSIR